jgi:hypothetical protein
MNPLKMELTLKYHETQKAALSTPVEKVSYDLGVYSASHVTEVLRTCDEAGSKIHGEEILELLFIEILRRNLTINAADSMARELEKEFERDFRERLRELQGGDPIDFLAD